MQQKLYSYIKAVHFQQYAAGSLVALISLIVITPLCGYLFDCGCTWPWAGLEAHCNIHDHNAEHQCPWCTSYLIGGFSVFLSISTGVLSAIFLARKNNSSNMDSSSVAATAGKIVQGTSTGMIVFLIIAFFTGWFAAMVQGNPSFLIN